MSPDTRRLRPYQLHALHALRETLRRGHRRVLVVMPTGTGKTVLFAEIARLAVGPVLVVAHRQELVEQARAKLAAWCDDVVAVEMAERRDLTASGGSRPKVSVASVQTISRRLHRIARDAFRVVVIDEAHHSTAESYRRLIEHFDTFVIGVTATPDRGDRRPLGEVYSAVAFEYDMPSAIRDGWLCPIRSFLVRTRADFSRVRKVAGELAAGDVERVLNQAPHLAEVAAPIVAERGERPAMVFAVSVAHAHALARVLCELAGDRHHAAALDGGVDSRRRRRTVERFRRGEIRVLVNCSLFTEGFDVPQIAMVAVARPVLSRAFYAQMIGRGTRIAPGKRDLLVLDFVPGNCRHRLVQAVDLFGGDDEVVDTARRVAAERSEAGEAIAVEQALELARQECEARHADVDYQLLQRDPFAAVGIDVGAGRWRRRGGEPAAADQIDYLRRAGLPAARLADLSRRQAEDLREHLLDRKAVGLCSPRQAAQLVVHGIDPRDLYRDQAAELLAFIRRERRHRSAEELRAGCVELGAPLLGESRGGGPI